MPADPGFGERLSSRVADVVSQAELALLRIIAALLKQGADDDGWAQAKLAQIQLLRQRLQAGTQKLDQAVVAEIQQVVLEAYNVGSGLALTDLDTAGIPAAVVAEPVAAASVIAAPAVLSSQAAARRLPDLLTTVYQQAVQAGADEVLGGQVTRLQAAQHVLDRLTSQGVGGYVDKAGRNWSLTSYVEMATRTASGQAAVQGHVDSLQSAGLDLVIVSDAPRECPLCRPYEGQILSISGSMVGDVVTRSVTSDESVRVNVFATLAQARAGGLQHPNCRHSLSAYLPGATQRKIARRDPEGYEATQRQRAMERKVREWKRREAVALTPEASAYARGKVRDWQKAIREHVDANDLKRLPAREQIGRAT